MVMYNYIVCERRYQSANTPLVPLHRGSQNNLSVYSSLENAYNQLIGYANVNRIEEVPFALKSLNDVKKEISENKDSNNFIVLVAHESQVSFVPSEPSLKVYDNAVYYLQVVLPDQILF